ncbi:MAG: hypothetical protein HY365_03455 [Candidatus Aenigmarchaeota archaeon]|nr:hypothetical protein [Candidatus Aenigmarchaeota archaeon]
MTFNIIWDTHSRAKRARGMLKGATQVDYIVSAGIFIVVFGMTVATVTDYYAGVSESTKITTLRSHALDMLDSLEKSPIPPSWTDAPDVLGIGGKAYRFALLVNNTANNYLNDGVTAQSLASEIVSFRYAEMAVYADVNSTVIYNETGATVPYSVSGDNISFTTALDAGQAKWFTVYYDRSSNFTSRSASVSGDNNLSQSVFGAEELHVVRYREMQKLSGATYATVTAATGVKDFYVEVFNTVTNTTYFTFGGAAPTRGNVVAVEKPIIYQNATADIITGKLKVRVW